MNHIRDIETMQFTTELQTFDRKSARIDAKALAIPIVAFANADGGDIAIGIEDNDDVTGQS
ncbi:MAG: ATP-binding protein [Lachnospiraceae bacterium]|nr:ATP-binding protein [Lachnospiraceae bacterium]